MNADIKSYTNNIKNVIKFCQTKSKQLKVKIKKVHRRPRSSMHYMAVGRSTMTNEQRNLIYNKLMVEYYR